MIIVVILVIKYTALAKQRVRRFFNKGVIKNRILPILYGLPQDAIDGQPPDSVDAIGGAVQERIFGPLFGGPEENIAHQDESMLLITYTDRQ